MKYLLLFVVCLACTKNEEVKIDYKVNLILNRMDTLQVPSSLLERLEEDYFKLSQRPVQRTVTQKKVLLSTMVREYLPIEVYLLDSKGTLKEPSYLFKADGGGKIDFAQYIANNKGDFVIGFHLDPKYNASNTKVYFLNNLKVNGCETYYDITDYFFSTLAKKGLLTTTNDLIHLKLLVGAFVFLSNIDDKYYMGQVYISDTRAEKALCQ